MKVKIFNNCPWSFLEREINEFLGNFAKIEKISFTHLKDSVVLCCYEGITWEEFNARKEKEYWASDVIRPSYDQMKDSYQ